MTTPKPRAGGAVVQQRRSGRGQHGRQGDNHSLYLSYDVWRAVEALAGTLGWTASRTVDRLLAMAIDESVADTSRGWSQHELKTLAYRVIELDLGQAQAQGGAA
ncbi:MAG: hypothetical protein AB7R89_13835 [Dehalococcoidia bacterium]